MATITLPRSSLPAHTTREEMSVGRLVVQQLEYGTKLLRSTASVTTFNTDGKTSMYLCDPTAGAMTVNIAYADEYVGRVLTFVNIAPTTLVTIGTVGLSTILFQDVTAGVNSIGVSNATQNVRTLICIPAADGSQLNWRLYGQAVVGA